MKDVNESFLLFHFFFIKHACVRARARARAYVRACMRACVGVNCTNFDKEYFKNIAREYN